MTSSPNLRAPFYENVDVAAKGLEVEKDRLPDQNEGRCYAYDTPIWRIVIYATMGLPLDPYSSYDLAVALDRVSMLIPLSGWKRRALRINLTLHSRSPFRDFGPLSQATASFYDPNAVDLETSIVDAGRTISNRFRTEMTKAMPDVNSMEPRIIVAYIVPFMITDSEVPSQENPEGRSKPQ